MSPQSRTLVVLAFLAGGGVLVLGFLAQRYAKMAAPAAARPVPEGSGAQSQGRVEAFIEVRRAMRRVIDGAADRPPRPDEVRRARDEAIAGVRLDAAGYDELRRAYRAWKAGRLARTEPIVLAFERLRDRLAEVDLAGYEPLDS